MQPRQPYTFDRVIRILILIITLSIILWLINKLSNVLLPFCIAALVAYILEPLVLFNKNIFKFKKRFPAIILTLIETVSIIIILGYIFIPSIITESQQVASMLKDYNSANVSSDSILAEVHRFIRKVIDFNKLSELFTTQDIKNTIDIVSSFLSSGVNIIIGLIGWFFILLYIIFIMLDYDKLTNGFKLMIPKKYRHITYSIGRDIKNSMNLYFRGQALVAFIVGILFSIGFLIIGLPLSIVLGMFIGLLNMVPYLQFISIFPTTLLCLVYSVNTGTDFWVIWWECIAVYTIVQIIQDLFLVPKIMGKAMGLNPAIILLSLSIWGSLFGFIGLIIALPLTTLLLSYYNKYVIGEKTFDSINDKQIIESDDKNV